jgi:MFS family permease
MGFAASLFWVSQGSLLTRCGRGVNMGLYSGIFTCINGLNGVIGNGVVGALFQYKVQQWYVFITLFCIGISGLLFFLPIRPLPPVVKKDDLIDAVPPTRLQSMLKLVKMTFQRVFEKKMMLLWALFLYNGYAQSFYFGVLPRKTPLELVPWTNLTFSFSMPIVSLLSGKGGDLIGVRWIFLAAFILHGAAITLSFFVFEVQETWLYFVTMFVCGVSLSATTTQIFATLGKLYQHSPGPSFASYNFMQSLATALSMLSGIYLEYLYIQIILISLLVAGAVFFFILDIFVQRVDKVIVPAETITPPVDPEPIGIPITVDNHLE